LHFERAVFKPYQRAWSRSIQSQRVRLKSFTFGIQPFT
jgi:hypothetical protein